MTEREIPERTQVHQRYPSPKKGRKSPGATTILGEWGNNKYILMAWQKKLLLEGEDPDKVRDKAASIGTLTHRLIEEHYGKKFDHIPENPVNLAEFPPEDLEISQKTFEAYLEWEDSFDTFEVIRSELQLGHPELMYGGTIDILWKLNGEYVIGDFKTSKSIYPENICQIAAYREMLLANSSIPEQWENAELLILHLSKESFKVTEHSFSAEEMEIPWRIFLNCLDIYYAKREMPK